ncbi:MAG: hypothetical protein CVV27_07125 [Candidatus Melainabacteria bacterium HGW-Melainabacteria-1]|nr:MAG: hypothetical protein CVV27_07125 [Candidatus Melainabacteria bacterium HGW-Melainabacteria-1]
MGVSSLTAVKMPLFRPWASLKTEPLASRRQWLLKQASPPQVEQTKIQERAFSESERQRRLVLINETRTLENFPNYL